MKYPWQDEQDMEKRQEIFIKYAKEHFGKADAETITFREKCKSLGVKVVMSTNMTNEEVIDFLEAEETQNILSSPRKHSLA